MKRYVREAANDFLTAYKHTAIYEIMEKAVFKWVTLYEYGYISGEEAIGKIIETLHNEK